MCCSDHIHCCPHGTTCDLSKGTCDKGDISVDWFVKTPALVVNRVQCDATHFCPDGDTCCKLTSGEWGCCPDPDVSFITTSPHF